MRTAVMIVTIWTIILIAIMIETHHLSHPFCIKVPVIRRTRVVIDIRKTIVFPHLLISKQI